MYDFQKHLADIDILSISCETALGLILQQYPIDDKYKMVRLMAWWCR